MDVQASEHAKRLILAHVRSGRFTSEGEVVEEALRLLDRPEQQSSPAKPKPLTEEEFQRRLVEMGLMDQIPDPSSDDDQPDDQPVNIKGKPLSETVISERR